MSYETTVAIVLGRYPRHLEDGWLLERPGKPMKVQTGAEVGSKGPPGESVTLADFGSALVEINLGSLREGELFDLFLMGRTKSRETSVWPYYFPVTGKHNKGMRSDYYADPLSVHHLEEVLEALVASMEAEKAKQGDTYRRYRTLLALLTQIRDSEDYGDVSVLSYGH